MDPYWEEIGEGFGTLTTSALAVHDYSKLIVFIMKLNNCCSPVRPASVIFDDNPKVQLLFLVDGSFLDFI